MPTLEFLIGVTAVCGAIIAVLTAAAMVRRKVIQPMRQTQRRWSEVADVLLGDPARGRLSLMERLAEQNEAQVANAAANRDNAETLRRVADQVTQQGHRLDEHLTWHSGGGRSRTNGPRPGPAPPVNQQ